MFKLDCLLTKSFDHSSDCFGPSPSDDMVAEMKTSKWTCDDLGPVGC